LRSREQQALDGLEQTSQTKRLSTVIGHLAKSCNYCLLYFVVARVVIAHIEWKRTKPRLCSHSFSPIRTERCRRLSTTASPHLPFPFLTLAFLICLLCRKSSFGFAPRAHWLDLSRSFSVHPFPPFIYRFATQNTRACTSTVWPRSLEIVTLGFAVASALDTYHDSFFLSHRRLASIQTSRFERIAPWRPQSLDCASCQVSSAVHVPNHPCPSTLRHWHQVHFSSSCKYPSLPVPAALLIVLALSWRAAITCTPSIALLTTPPSHFRHKPPYHHGCRASAPKATAY
jgi:hypothetical protein